ncbi:MAG: YneF family protein [Bacilli bacterium]|nr:YneF family protein [Bacilli bacterium]
MYYQTIIIFFVGVIIGVIIGFFIAKIWIQKIIKNNPLINEDLINAIFSGMGHKQSKKQTKNIMEKIKKLTQDLK